MRRARCLTPGAYVNTLGRSMRYPLLFVAVTFALFAAENPPATYVGHDAVAKALANGGAIASGTDYRVSGVRRNKPGQVEVHDKETDIFYIVEGEATFVTGGTMVGGKQSGAGQWLGTDIQGGETHHLAKGDVIV